MVQDWTTDLACSLGAYPRPSRQSRSKSLLLYRAEFVSSGTVEVVSLFIKRWTIEVTFEESRAHLGVETQRQWSDLAIERSTPCLLGMFSLVALFGQALHPDGDIPVQQIAWYHKTETTFSDVLAEVGHHLWGNFTYHTSSQTPDVCLVPRSHVIRRAYALCH